MCVQTRARERKEITEEKFSKGWLGDEQNKMNG